MSVTTYPGYLVRRLADAPTVPCPCGQSTRPLTRTETPACNLHVTFITDSVLHYHKDCTEVYYILEGRGKMELNGEVYGSPSSGLGETEPLSLPSASRLMVISYEPLLAPAYFPAHVPIRSFSVAFCACAAAAAA